MATDYLAAWWVHDTTVERLTGQGPSGPTYAAGETLKGFCDAKTRLVRNATGSEVTSSTTVYYPPGTPFIKPGSYITMPPVLGSRRAKVIGCQVHDAGTLPTPNHVEVTLE